MTKLKVLQVVAYLPSMESPWRMPFVAQQIESLRELGLEIDILDLSAYGSGVNRYAAGIRALRQRVQSNHYDVIHAHYSYCGWVAKCQRHVPVVVSLMGSDLLGSPDVHGRQTARGWFDVVISQMLARWADSIIVKSKGMAEQFRREERVWVIPNGVSFQEFRPLDRLAACRQLGLDPGKKRILFAADPGNPVKNFKLAEEAHRILRALDDSPCDLWAFYRQRHDLVPLAMNAADVLLFTSFWEGSPNVVKEAMACNLPIVSVRVGDVPEVIGNAHNCYLADYDPADLAAKVKCVLASGERSNGRQFVEHLRVENVARKLNDIYVDVLKR